VSLWFDLETFKTPLLWLTAIFGLLTAVYTAFLFSQAKGRDFWQSPVLPIHMVVHSFMAGAASLIIIAGFTNADETWVDFLKNVLVISLGINLITLVVELFSKHPTVDAASVVGMIIKGRYSKLFWFGVAVAGNLIPLLLLIFGGTVAFAIGAVLSLTGIYFTEKIWVEAPQRVPLA
jgi:formate-dependent nitrite reductase membrane component NrfD